VRPSIDRLKGSPGVARIENQCHRTVILKLECAAESSEGLVKTQATGPHPQNFWFSGARDSAFLASSQVMADVLVLGTHFKDH